MHNCVGKAFVNEEDDILGAAQDVISSVGPAGVDSSGEIRINPSGGHPTVRPLGGRTALNVFATLHIGTGKDSGEYPISLSPYQIGSTRGHLRLRDRFVDPWHAQLSGATSLVLDDLGSTNGVFLRIADALTLEDGDEVAIGHQRFTYRNTWDPPIAKIGTPLAGGAPPAHAHRLIVHYQDGVLGPAVPLNGPLLIGRGNVDLGFPGDPQVSAVHATIEPHSEGRFAIKDLQSEHGTFIRIHDPMELIDGDTFLVGRTPIVIRYP